MIVKAIAAGARTSPLALLLNPTFWIVISVWSAIVALYAADLGAERERLKQIQITAQALQKQVEANDRVLAAERKLRTEDNAEFIKFKEVQAHAEKAHSQLVSDLSGDIRRLRIPVRRPVCPGAAPAGGAPAEGNLDEGFADVDPTIAVALVSLTDRGDSAIRKHAEVVDRYERLRLACTAPPEATEP